MSTTYHIVCDDCQQTLWIGQRGSGNRYPRIYTTQPHLHALTLFLIVHENHHLMFGFDGGFPIEPQGPLRGEDYRAFTMADVPEGVLREWDLSDADMQALRDAIEY